MTPLFADMVWPALYVMSRSYTWWGIGLGLVVEYLALKAIADVTWKSAAVPVIVVNAASALLGYFAIPALTLGWEFVLSYTIYQVIRVGTFNVFGWIATVLVMGAITAAPEYLLLILLFKIRFKKSRPWLWWWLANCVSVFIAFLTVLIWPVHGIE
jgi:hypothetical protein